MISVTVNNNLKLNETGIHWHGIRQLNNTLNDGVGGLTECKYFIIVLYWSTSLGSPRESAVKTLLRRILEDENCEQKILTLP